MMNFIDDFDRWWLNVGQFLGPAATANEQQREMLREYAHHLSNEVKQPLHELELELEKALADASDCMFRQ